VLGIAGSPNPEITIYKITKEFIDDGHSFPITYVSRCICEATCMLTNTQVPRPRSLHPNCDWGHYGSMCGF